MDIFVPLGAGESLGTRVAQQKGVIMILTAKLLQFFPTHVAFALIVRAVVILLWRVVA